jgi:hypothetical protein
MRLRTQLVPCTAASLPLLLAVLAPCAQAQWSADPSANLVVGLIDGYVDYRVAVTADGGCWVAWGTHVASGFELRVQRFDAAGHSVFPYGGIVALALQDFNVWIGDCVVTDSGELVVGVNRLSGDVLQRLRPSGLPLWGPVGLQTSRPTSFTRIAAFEDDVVLAGFELGTGLTLAQRIDRTGAEAWGGGVLLTPFSHTSLGIDVDSSGVVIAGYVWSSAGTGLALAVQRVDALGGLPWGPNASRVSGSAPVGFWTGAPAIRATGAGGAILAYPVELSLGINDVFVQRLDPQGAVMYGPFGMPVSTLVQGRDTFDLEYDDVSDGAVVAWWERELVFPPTATPASLRVQNIDAAGTRRWTPTGMELSDGGMGTNSTDIAQLALGAVDPSGIGRTAFIAWGRSSDDSLYGGRVDAAGHLTGGETTLYQGGLPPEFLDIRHAESGEPQAIVAWIPWDAWSTSHELRLQNLRGDGGIGGPIGLGDEYCEGGPNSTGERATLRAEGSAIVSRDLFRLQARELPPNQVGSFLFAPSAGFSPNPGGSPGDLCLSRPIGRGPLWTSDASGQVLEQVDLTGLPSPTGTTAVLAGETWHFQGWYREANGQGNYTGGLRVQFL